ncbi:Hypothetical predicted protein, partial [Drosophila guanche]
LCGREPRKNIDRAFVIWRKKHKEPMEPKRERKRLYRVLGNHELNLSSSSSSPASVARQ